MCPGVGPEVWFRCFACCLADIVCRGHAQYTAFAPNGDFALFSYLLVSLYLLGPELAPPALRLHTVLFSPMQSLYVLLL